MGRILPFLWLGLWLGCAFAFHERYWRWRDCFNELGRCYDSEAGIMVEQAGWIWGSLALIFGVMFGRGVWRHVRTSKRPL